MNYVQVIIWTHQIKLVFKMTEVVLELTPDPYMYIFFENGTTCGISNCSNRYSIANKKYLKYYDTKQESTRICLDSNNFNGCAMPKFLPTSGFKWVDPNESELNK